MKNLTIIWGVVLISLSLLSCDSNTKLSQANAEKAINEFLSKGSDYFQINSVKNFGTLSQFSDNEATMTVTFEYSSKNVFGEPTNGEIQIKCIFKKNVDKKWIFNSIESITHFIDWNGYAKWIQNNQDMNIIAQ
jgi:hypothetical protein